MVYRLVERKQESRDGAEIFPQRRHSDSALAAGGNWSVGEGIVVEGEGECTRNSWSGGVVCVWGGS